MILKRVDVARAANIYPQVAHHLHHLLFTKYIDPTIICLLHSHTLDINGSICFVMGPKYVSSFCLILYKLQVAKANSLSEEEVKGLVQLGKVTRVNLKKTKEVAELLMDDDQDSVITLE